MGEAAAVVSVSEQEGCSKQQSLHLSNACCGLSVTAHGVQSRGRPHRLIYVNTTDMQAVDYAVMSGRSDVTHDTTGMFQFQHVVQDHHDLWPNMC